MAVAGSTDEIRIFPMKETAAQHQHLGARLDSLPAAKI
jgi:hypothetical protein